MTVSDKLDADVSLNKRFYVGPDSFSFHRQYSKTYFARFNSAKPILVNSAARLWNAVTNAATGSKRIPLRSLNNLATNERCVIIGTIYKEMKLKPSILKHLVANDATRIIKSFDAQRSLMSSDDSIFLEDDLQRITLVFKRDLCKSLLSPSNLVTGVLVALLGHEPENEQGSFYVEDAVFLEPQPLCPITIHRPKLSVNPASCTSFHNSGPWLAVVSGLGFVGAGPTNPGHAMALQLLADWLRCSGEWTENSADGLGVVRLMILGDSIQPSGTPNSYGSTGSSYLTQQARYLTRNTEADSVTAMARFDAWLATLPLGPGYVPSSSSPSNSRNGLPVDVLPGQMDPTPQLLPQQPIHAMTLPLAVSRAGGTRRGGLSGRTNPFMINVFGRKVLATSGQGILDLELYSDLETPCDRMEATLLWGHLAPTCPDTIPGYPVEDDLLLLAQQRTEKGALSCSPDYPDIYLAGCQPGTTVQWRRAALTWRQKMSTEQDTKKGSLLVAVPRFSLSFSFVLVHLETLDCRVIRFDCSALDSPD